MTRFTKIAAAAFIAAATMGSFAQPAAAQGAATGSYCNGAVALRSLYRNIVSNGQTAEAVYMGQFQATGRPVTANIGRLTEIRIGNLRFPVVRIVGRIQLTTAWDFKELEVLALTINNPGGTGAPSPEDVKNTLVVTCTFPSAH